VEGEFQRIPDDFYERIGEMIKERMEKKAGLDEDEYLEIEDEIRSLKRARMDVFKVRLDRILKLAWKSVCCKETEGLDNMTKSERDVFERIVEILESFKAMVFGERKKEKDSKAYVLVRVKRDVPEFEGVDGRVYKLRREDVALLPNLNAKALIDGGFVDLLEFKR
jgi:DNA replication factor GINS